MFVGVVLVEVGYGTGYFVTKAYGVYAFILSVCILFLFYVLKNKFVTKEPRIDEASFSSIQPKLILQYALGLQLLILVIVVYFFDGLSVVTGRTFRGDYRIQFGHLGFVLAFLTKYLAPSLLVLSSIFLAQNISKLKWSDYFVFAGHFFITFTIGLLMGGKTTALRIVIGALIVIFYQQLRKRTLVVLGIFFTVVLLVGGIIFDKRTGFSDVANYVAQRMTTIQARAPWHVYRQHSQGTPLPEYFPTLLSFLGSPGITFFTGAEKNSLEYAKFDYGIALTKFVEGPREDILKGSYNLTGGIFSELIIMCGHDNFFYYFMILFAAALISFNIFLIDRFHKNAQYAAFTVSVCYFVYVTLSWVNSGGLTLLFHVVTLFGTLATYCSLVGLLRWASLNSKKAVL